MYAMQVAWLFNIRGSDILFNPVAIAAALLTQEEAFLFIDAAKLGEDVQQVKRCRAGERRDGLSVCRRLLILSRAFPHTLSRTSISDVRRYWLALVSVLLWLIV